mmetsp:Transcript_12362/g.37705  ORF Transcript_12362/g.37705 Transcript_12362/m.37705 type:complete len:364 (+) Transcript_12362:194-1285(+)
MPGCGDTVAAHVMLAFANLGVLSSARPSARWKRRNGLCCMSSHGATENDVQFQDLFAKRMYALQDHVCHEVVEADKSGQHFQEDEWQRTQGSGGGRTRVLEDGDLFEKAAANVSVVRGRLNAERASAMRERGNRSVEADTEYFAAALSIVFHSLSPMVPTLRGDVRVFQTTARDENGQKKSIAWAGGGADLTPSYLYEKDAVEFHRYWKQVCDRHSVADYANFKAWCDRYFYIPMRKEHRGIGGIFFDDLDFSEPAQVEGFLSDVATGWMQSFRPIAERRRKEPYGKQEREWQLIRRGRYAEFNLVYDRGVRFGLLGGGRTESIMVSAPPLIRWKYNYTPAQGSREEELLKVLRQPRDWASMH